jgi:hypothetical protein
LQALSAKPVQRPDCLFFRRLAQYSAALKTPFRQPQQPAAFIGKRSLVDLSEESWNLLFQVLQDWRHHLASLDLEGLGCGDDHSRHDFNKISKGKREAPFSLRLTFEKRWSCHVFVLLPVLV